MVAHTDDVQTSLPRPFDPFSLVPYTDDLWQVAKSRTCFQDDESNVQIDWTESDSEHRVTRRTFSSLAELQAHKKVASTVPNGLRFISINQVNSWRPLNVTQEMFEEIGKLTKSSHMLHNLSLSFHDKFIATEAAFSSAPIFVWNEQSIEVAYIFKYAFQKTSNDKPDSWTIRQTGVYQKFDTATKHSTWIFLNPTKDCLFQQRLMDMLMSPSQCSQLTSHPMLIHNLLFATFFPKWREYLGSHEATVLTVSNTTVTERIQDPLRVNHHMLTSIRSVESRCLPLQALFRSFDRTVQTLHKANNALRDCGSVQHLSWHKMDQLLDNYESHADAYLQAASFLQSRAATTAQLIADTFSFKNSHTAQEQSDYMLDLTSSTVDDSSTVRVITVVTLIYLPSTFMATLLGMNSFFEMDPQTHHLVVSPQFWIFVVCAVPLTAVTVLYWWVRSKRHPKHAKGKVELLA
ncbi:CorA-like Mg2+ transporter protein [Aspergillus parasiticus SU-1]|uniref:CorA-like Mg2+ transporter protein n=1 Tax=Aspergillus parasiticus (strain ATCC 56775 / NRRL 5862 / SRRC 143 / SU-1) TaxID=1403190 RepID=A0A0F0I1Q6_ASPPU|nr:CorA-like Mg2+ transporter protein [Aspergillus parasiticus SU-1]